MELQAPEVAVVVAVAVDTVEELLVVQESLWLDMTVPASAGTAKATGGAISFYGGKTIHTFVQALELLLPTPDWSAATGEYVVIGGGGGGGGSQGGGGGAGAYRTGTTPIGAHPVSTTIQIGGGGDGGFGSPNTLVETLPELLELHLTLEHQ